MTKEIQIEFPEASEMLLDHYMYLLCYKYLEQRYIQDLEDEEFEIIKPLNYLIEGLKHIDTSHVRFPAGIEGYNLVSNIAATACNVLDEYKPKKVKNFSIVRNNRTFVLTPDRARIVLDEPLEYRYTLQELAENLELNRLKTRSYDALKTDKEVIKAFGDDFQLKIEEVCLLMREDGESLPTNPADLRRFKEERYELLKDVTVKEYRDLNFFLFNTIVKSKQMGDMKLLLKVFPKLLNPTRKPRKR